MSSRAWALLSLLAAIPFGVGVWLAIGAIEAASGYAATYAFGGAWFLAIALVLFSLLVAVLCLARRKTRKLTRTLLFGALGGPILLVAFYISYGVGTLLYPNRWPGDRLVPLDEGSHFVVIFKADATERDIAAFMQRKIDVPSSNERGHNLRRQVSSISRTAPTGGQQTLTVGYWKSLSAAERERLRISLASWPAVDRIVNDLPFPDRPPQMLRISPTPSP